jgi:chromosome segregation protein
MVSRLKSLELHGYKTFASRINFDYPTQITAIVGPNGAGKSNVADSLRWVLGEQSYTLLRGRKTEDMIFAGSEFRPKASMASATITFDNEDGWLPIDYSEVSITRRAYRDGQNEYLLNGQKVRLKEIGELLGKSGLAERTYTIIGQGLVDAALSLKPDERRKFFEEAAGIGLYRGRREEAINRLDNTRRNLERVRDILSELEPRLQSLEKQARRAMEYERVKADLQLLLRDWYGYHWHRSQDDLLHAQDVFHAQDERLGQARKRYSEVEQQVEVARGKLQTLRNELNRWHTQSSDLHRQREQISRNLAVMDERQRSLTNQQQSLKSDLGRLEEEHEGHLQRLAARREEHTRLQTELSDAQSGVEKARRLLRERQVEREQAERDLRDARRSLVDNETKQVQTRAHLNELVNRGDGQKKSRQSLADAVEREAQAVKKAEALVVEANKQRENAIAELKKAEESFHAIRNQIDEVEAARKKSSDDRNRLDAERSRLKAQLDVLEQAERSFSGLNQGSKFLLQSAQKGQLKGGYRPLNSLLDIPAEYETAIAAVLGEFLDGILLDDQTDPEQALLLLEQGEKGRAVLLPNKLSLNGDRFSQDLGDDCVGMAADVIRAPEKYQEFINQLLSQVVIARHRSAARRIAAQLPASARVVTLKGEVFWGSGVVIAGQDGRSGVISRPRQKRELQTALEESTVTLNAVSQKLTETEKQLADYRAREKALDQEQRQANQRVNQLTQIYQKTNLDAEQARQRGEWQRKQLAGLEDQIARTDKEIKQIETSLQEIANRITTCNEQVRERSRTLNGLPMDELQAEVNHWTTSAAVAARAVKDAENRVDEYQQTLTTNEQQQQSTSRRIEEAAAALAQLEKEKGTYRQQESQVNRQMDILQEQIDPAEEELSDMERGYSELQQTQTAAQQSVSAADRYATQAQLELSRQREALDSLRRKIEDDFGLVSLEFTNNVTGQDTLPLGDMVKQLPMLTEIPQELEENINRQRGQLRRMGSINPDAQTEYESVRERYDFLVDQVEDLKTADEDLRKVISELDDLMRREFKKTFDAVAAEFKQMFTRLFGGGSARLVLIDGDSPVDAGIDIEARLPGRREQGLALLSGGERSLTAVALIFSLLKVSPTPFCVMDEVDAALDEANVGRFCELLTELSKNTQFILITHNRNTVQTAGVIYGVTMGRDSASQIISLKLDEIGEDMVHA